VAGTTVVSGVFCRSRSRCRGEGGRGESWVDRGSSGGFAKPIDSKVGVVHNWDVWLSLVQSSSWRSVAPVQVGAASEESHEGSPMSAWSSVINLEEEMDGEGTRGESLGGSCHALSQGFSMDGTGDVPLWR
jgi:hypothetical protein